MRARSARFVTSAADPAGFPPPDLPEVAFAGRSNVGKSSLINALCGAANLAKTSRTPGRTRLLNWFRVAPPKGEPLHFVDLPGYGYARVPRAVRQGWRPLVEGYLRDRSALRGVVVLVDARRGPEEDERDLLAWLADLGVPARAVLTKADKLSKSKRKPAALAAQRALGLPAVPALFSAHTRDGADDVWRLLTSLVRQGPRQ